MNYVLTYDLNEALKQPNLKGKVKR